MRVVVLNADYEPFLASLYSEHPDLAAADWNAQLAVRNGSLFGVADFYSRHLRALGHDAWDLHVNNEPMQRAWLREHRGDDRSVQRRRWEIAAARRRVAAADGVEAGLRAAARTVRRSVRAFDRAHEVLRQQLEYLRPDVVWNQAMDWISPQLLASVRSSVGLVVGQVAAPLPEDLDLSPYDLVLSSLPNFVERFRRAGVSAELQALAFEPAILDSVPATGRDLPFTFVGSVSTAHAGRTRLLETLCERTPLQLWGALSADLPPDSPIRARHRGPAWGRDMYAILRRSQLTLNGHIDVAEGHANNMRLFEATGVGATLLTDHGRNLGELFEPELEVATYGSIDSCVAEADRLLSDHDTREAIGVAGQQRTLRDHTYAERAASFVRLVERYR